MSSKWREREKRKEREQRNIEEELERNRLAARSTYEVIQDLDVGQDLKDLLHEITDRIGL